MMAVDFSKMNEKSSNVERVVIGTGLIYFKYVLPLNSTINTLDIIYSFFRQETLSMLDKSHTAQYQFI
jgi:hypothetical protein